MNIPNFNLLPASMSQFGPKQTMQQGYANTVTGAVPAYQNLLSMQKQNPGYAGYMPGLTAKPAGWDQYQRLQQQAQPVMQFAGYAARQGMGDPRQIAQQIGQKGIGNYAPAAQNYGNWMNREVKRANANGMLAKGFSAMLPNLLMSAIPAVGLAKFGIGAAMGGIRGGPMGAIKGALPSPANYLKRFV